MVIDEDKTTELKYSDLLQTMLELPRFAQLDSIPPPSFFEELTRNIYGIQ